MRLAVFFASQTIKKMSTARPTASTLTSAPSGTRVAVVAARFNADIVQRLTDSCLKRLASLNVTQTQLVHVPGAFELPSACAMLARTRKFDAIIALGCVIRGDTPHFEYVAGSCASGLMQLGVIEAMPVIFGVLTVNTHEQAVARAGGEHGEVHGAVHGDAGISAAEAAVEMVLLRKGIGDRR